MTDRAPIDALRDCLEAWQSGAWGGDNEAPANLAEVMPHVRHLLAEVDETEKMPESR